MYLLLSLFLYFFLLCDFVLFSSSSFFYFSFFISYILKLSSFLSHEFIHVFFLCFVFYFCPFLNPSYLCLSFSIIQKSFSFSLPQSIHYSFFFSFLLFFCCPCSTWYIFPLSFSFPFIVISLYFNEHVF